MYKWYFSGQPLAGKSFSGQGLLAFCFFKWIKIFFFIIILTFTQRPIFGLKVDNSFNNNSNASGDAPDTTPDATPAVADLETEATEGSGTQTDTDGTVTDASAKATDGTTGSVEYDQATLDQHIEQAKKDQEQKDKEVDSFSDAWSTGEHLSATPYGLTLSLGMKIVFATSVFALGCVAVALGNFVYFLCRREKQNTLRQAFACADRLLNELDNLVKASDDESDDPNEKAEIKAHIEFFKREIQAVQLSNEDASKKTGFKNISKLTYQKLFMTYQLLTDKMHLEEGIKNNPGLKVVLSPLPGTGKAISLQDLYDKLTPKMNKMLPKDPALLDKLKEAVESEIALHWELEQLKTDSNPARTHAIEGVQKTLADPAKQKDLAKELGDLQEEQFYDQIHGTEADQADTDQEETDNIKSKFKEFAESTEKIHENNDQLKSETIKANSILGFSVVSSENEGGRRFRVKTPIDLINKKSRNTGKSKS